VDVVLMLGPLYHLTERDDRVRALAEARRVVRPGGLVASAAISRFASLLDGLNHRFLDDPRFAAIVERDLATGQHRNPDAHEGWFTTAYFHLPSELPAELADAGLRLEALLGLEGPGWLFPDLIEDDSAWETLMHAARAVEEEPALLGISAHLLAVAFRPD
jgi:SAM-dependent methyltransferase